jgi:peptidyl-prolyl cis-trans isomerase A (cyclophilin A)
MQLMRPPVVVLFTVLLLAGAGLTASQDTSARLVLIETELGRIEVALDMEQAPATATNFLRYVEEGLFTDGQFHRTVTLDNQPDNDILIEVIQASVNREFRESGYEPISLERTNTTGLKHLDGTISMARGGPDSATSSFFICVGDQPSLDFGGMRNADGQGFAAFGRVTNGMDVVRKIQQAPAEGQSLTPPVRILSITVIGEND